MKGKLTSPKLRKERTEGTVVTEDYEWNGKNVKEQQKEVIEEK